MLSKNEKVILKELKKERSLDLESLMKRTGLGKDAIKRGGYFLSQKGLAKMNYRKENLFSLTHKGKEVLLKGFEEESIDNLSVKDLPEEVRERLWIARETSFFSIEKGVVRKNKDKFILREVLEAISSNTLEEGKYSKYLPYLEKKGLIKKIEEEKISFEITPEGEAYVLEEKEGLDELSEEVIKSLDWKKKEFKPYYIDYSSIKKATSGKLHPFTLAINKIRSVFLSLGFKELQGDYVESSFWVFDALFQPQDHPSRELADTFFLNKKERVDVDDITLNRVKEEHQRYWKYPWKKEIAEKLVLRTHTTVLSARALYEFKKGKFFAIGRVFRNEAIDYKHLAEFHQIEGIIAWRGANFRNLLWILKKFFTKLGFEKIRFRPSYFPYTEPSLEVEYYFEEKNEWMEIGGAGIFRKQVSSPLLAEYPVLAWGLSLERLLMLILDLSDIREFYKNKKPWLDNISSNKIKRIEIKG